MKLTIGNGCVLKNGLPLGFVITDEKIFEEYGFLIKGKKFVIKSGEESKSIEKYVEILKNLGNIDTIIAFGGGVVGDLAGFVASTYKRGINFIQVPTSLTAMVDSSIGGKNGVNLCNKKNYVGTFYQPNETLIDPLFLKSLSKKEFSNGIAEVIKYRVLFGKPSLQRRVKRISLNDNLKELISICVKLKMKVVKEDEKDLGYRHILNFGHTIGHAFELVYKMSHGEAISIGMVAEMGLGKTKGLFSEEKISKTKNLLEVNGLPTKFPKDFDVEEILDSLKFDKKGEFVFSFDRYHYDTKFSEDEVRNFLENERNNQ